MPALLVLRPGHNGVNAGVAHHSNAIGLGAMASLEPDIFEAATGKI
jgi:hypothetical protein